MSTARLTQDCHKGTCVELDLQKLQVDMYLRFLQLSWEAGRVVAIDGFRDR